MKTLKYLPLILILSTFSSFAAKTNSTETPKKKYIPGKLTLEPALGIHPSPTADLSISNMIQWNPARKLSIVSHTSYSFNNAFHRNFNYIKTNYNYSLSQIAGIGTTFYAKHSSHAFSLMAGIKYDAYKETLENPEFESFSASANSLRPDAGLMYNLKIGTKKFFFSYRMYIPLYPYPFKSTDIYSIDGNLANISLEFGLGIWLK